MLYGLVIVSLLLELWVCLIGVLVMHLAWVVCRVSGLCVVALGFDGVFRFCWFCLFAGDFADVFRFVGCFDSVSCVIALVEWLLVLLFWFSLVCWW